MFVKSLLDVNWTSRDDAPAPAAPVRVEAERARVTSPPSARDVARRFIFLWRRHGAARQGPRDRPAARPAAARGARRPGARHGAGARLSGRPVVRLPTPPHCVALRRIRGARNGGPVRFFGWPDVHFLPSARRDVGVMLTTDEHMRRLNRRYRQKDKTTDILSFPFHKVCRQTRGFRRHENAARTARTPDRRGRGESPTDAACAACLSPATSGRAANLTCCPADHTDATAWAGPTDFAAGPLPARALTRRALLGRHLHQPGVRAAAVRGPSARGGRHARAAAARAARARPVPLDGVRLAP